LTGQKSTDQVFRGQTLLLATPLDGSTGVTCQVRTKNASSSRRNNRVNCRSRLLLSHIGLQTAVSCMRNARPFDWQTAKYAELRSRSPCYRLAALPAALAQNARCSVADQGHGRRGPCPLPVVGPYIFPQANY